MQRFLSVLLPSLKYFFQLLLWRKHVRRARFNCFNIAFCNISELKYSTNIIYKITNFLVCCFAKRKFSICRVKGLKLVNELARNWKSEKLSKNISISSFDMLWITFSHTLKRCSQNSWNVFSITKETGEQSKKIFALNHFISIRVVKTFTFAQVSAG